MYAMVLRQLNPMQKGIQALHAVVEYAQEKFNDKEYQQWADQDKTMVVLDGGTSVELAEVMKRLDELNYAYVTFNEPDLYNQVTAIAFLAPETVWDVENYPDYKDYKIKKMEGVKFSDFFSSKPNDKLFQGLLSVSLSDETWAKEVFKADAKAANLMIDMRKLIFSKKLSN